MPTWSASVCSRVSAFSSSPFRPASILKLWIIGDLPLLGALAAELAVAFPRSGGSTTSCRASIIRRSASWRVDLGNGRICGAGGVGCHGLRRVFRRCRSRRAAAAARTRGGWGDAGPPPRRPDGIDVQNLSTLIKVALIVAFIAAGSASPIRSRFRSCPSPAISDTSSARRSCEPRVRHVFVLGWNAATHIAGTCGTRASLPPAILAATLVVMVLYTAQRGVPLHDADAMAGQLNVAQIAGEHFRRGGRVVAGPSSGSVSAISAICGWPARAVAMGGISRYYVLASLGQGRSGRSWRSRPAS